MNWARLLIHIPWGLLAAFLYVMVLPSFGIVALVSMLVYEGFNDWRKKDNSYHDVLGIVWGWLIGGIIWLIVRWLL